MSFTEEWLLSHGYELRADGWYKAGGVAQAPERKPSVGYEPVGTDEGKVADKKRRVVRITSYRLRLIDERNLFDKHFTDALVDAGLIVDDSPQWAQIIVEQKQIRNPAWERTEIEITDS